jgi:hypothetical protein
MTLVIGLWLLEQKNAYAQEQAGAKDSLKWAARTYVVAFRINCNVALLYFNLYGRKETKFNLYNYYQIQIQF